MSTSSEHKQLQLDALNVSIEEIESDIDELSDKISQSQSQVEKYQSKIASLKERKIKQGLHSTSEELLSLYNRAVAVHQEDVDELTAECDELKNQLAALNGRQAWHSEEMRDLRQPIEDTSSADRATALAPCAQADEGKLTPYQARLRVTRLEGILSNKQRTREMLLCIHADCQEKIEDNERFSVVSELQRANNGGDRTDVYGDQPKTIEQDALTLKEKLSVIDGRLTMVSQDISQLEQQLEQSKQHLLEDQTADSQEAVSHMSMP